MADKACECMRDLNDVVSMSLRLMEGIADNNWERASLYRDLTEKSVKDVGKCAGVDLTKALSTLENAKEFIEKKETYRAMRTLEDAFWETIAFVCR